MRDVCFQFTHFSCDDWEHIYTLSYYHHQIGSMNFYPLFRVRSWNNVFLYSYVNNFISNMVRFGAFKWQYQVFRHFIKGINSLHNSARPHGKINNHPLFPHPKAKKAAYWVIVIPHFKLKCSYTFHNWWKSKLIFAISGIVMLARWGSPYFININIPCRLATRYAHLRRYRNIYIYIVECNPQSLPLI